MEQSIDKSKVTENFENSLMKQSNLLNEFNCNKINHNIQKDNKQL
jgi:hypothetical protein